MRIYFQFRDLSQCFFNKNFNACSEAIFHFHSVKYFSEDAYRQKKIVPD
ncbi:hypothetical protein GW12_16290 [Acinetobacter sp. HR7]|nr:hypothetical protein GW12_16290 [Acinetobacter sp. HR7]